LLTLKKANTRAKVKTIARARAVVRPVTPAARARTPAKAKEAAQLTEANRLKLSDEFLAAYLSSSSNTVLRGPEFSDSALEDS
jgi:hypothetical protein